MAPSQRPLLPLLLLLLPLPPPPPFARAQDAARANSDRYAVYWNRSNPRSCAALSAFPGLGGPPSWGLSGDPCQHRSSWRSPGNLVAEPCQVGDRGPQGKGTLAATPPNAVDQPCLRLKVYVRPTNETLYEAPEPIFTSNNSCSGLGSCRLVLSTVPVLWTLLGS
nr:ephrin-A2 [Neomonachus schauinslandi]